MPFESESNEGGMVVSPGGHVFGVQGWTYGQPVPKSLTFFLDGTCLVADQYGRPIRGAQANDGRQYLFAMTPPEANREGFVITRPQYATHAQTLESLRAEGINWLAYEVRYVNKQGGGMQSRSNLSKPDATKMQERLIREGHGAVMIVSAIACAGWPQLPYDELKKLPPEVLPPIPPLREAHQAYLGELRKIPDPVLRRDAIKYRKEMYEAFEAQTRMEDTE